METIDKIKMLLKEKGLDQKDLTSYLGITKSVFSAWNKGTSTSYTKYYNEIADFFGVPVSAIVDDETAMVIDQALSDFRKMRQHKKKEKSPLAGTKELFKEMFSEFTDNEIDDLMKYARFLIYLRSHSED